MWTNGDHQPLQVTVVAIGYQTKQDTSKQTPEGMPESTSVSITDMENTAWKRVGYLAAQLAPE